MLLRKALGIALRRKTLSAAAAICLVAVPTALAATVAGDGTLVGTAGSDTIAAGNGNDTVWGLGGQDTISAGNGNDVIDGNGHCSPAPAPGDYPHGLPGLYYCEHGWIGPPYINGDTISAGNGNAVVYGGGGRNTISVGNGNDTIYGGPVGDTTSAGNGNDAIYLGSGSSYTGSRVSVGNGSGVIYAQNGVKDTVSCGAKNNYKVYADTGVDAVNGCKTVLHRPEPAFDPWAQGKHGKQRKHAKHDTKRRTK